MSLKCNLHEICSEIDIETVFELNQMKNLSFRMIREELNSSLFNEGLPFTQRGVIVADHRL